MKNKEYLKEAEKVAIEVGQYLLKEQATLSAKEAKVGRDIKIEADKWADQRIRECLGVFNYPIYSEEREGNWDFNGYYWVVDPLDGSYNYHAGIPFCAVSIALWKDNEPLLGVIYHIHGGNMFSALKDIGLYHNGKKVTRSRVLSEFDILCTGIPVGMLLNDSTLGQFVRNIKEYKKIRMMGSASLMLAYVAMGKSSAYSERGIMLWDVAAGIALCKEAGLNVKTEIVEGLKLNVSVTS